MVISMLVVLFFQFFCMFGKKYVSRMGMREFVWMSGICKLAFPCGCLASFWDGDWVPQTRDPRKREILVEAVSLL